MDREKEIEEVYDIIDEVVSDCNNDRVFGVYSAAENVVNAGYRKADEVRKETAKEILDLLIRYDDGDSNSEAIKLIIDHYGLQEYIEVDE